MGTTSALAPTASGRAAMRFAALVTVAVAVGMDLLAGEHPLHTVTVGVIAAVVAGMRARCAGRGRGYYAVLSGAIVAQPALHATSKLLPATSDTPFGHLAESSVSLAHVLLAALVVAVVTGADRLFSVLAAVSPVARLLALLVRSPRPRARIVCPRRTVKVPLVRWLVVADVSLRGPPRGGLAAA